MKMFKTILVICIGFTTWTNADVEVERWIRSTKAYTIKEMLDENLDPDTKKILQIQFEVEFRHLKNEIENDINQIYDSFSQVDEYFAKTCRIVINQRYEYLNELDNLYKSANSR